MDKIIIVGFNGAPQSWKSTTATNTMHELSRAGIETANISFVGFWNQALPELMRSLDYAFNGEYVPQGLNYEQAKKVEILGVTGRDFQIAATEAFKRMIPDLPAKYAAALIKRHVEYRAPRPRPLVLMLENVGFAREYEILEELELPIIKVYMTEKRPEYENVAYKFGDAFRGDSRQCLFTNDSHINPDPALLATLIMAKLGL